MKFIIDRNFNLISLLLIYTLCYVLCNIDVIYCEDYPSHLGMTKNQDHYWLRKKKDVFMYCLGEYLGMDSQEMEFSFYQSTNQKFRQSFNDHMRTCMNDTGVKELASYYYENFFKQYR